jgi:uncharacterized protein
MTRYSEPFVDHHCHAVVLADMDRAEFESMLNEAAPPSRLGTTPFDSMVGLAVRRRCAPVLGLDPLCDPDTYLAHRHELGYEEVTRRLLGAAAVSDLVVDTGFEPRACSSFEQLADLSGARVHEIVRLEAIGEELLSDGVGPAEFGDRVRERLRSADAVGAKSIAAYRVGLSLPATKPTDDALANAVGEIRPQADGVYRIAQPVVNAWLAWTAIEERLPLQFHVGYGDSDLTLNECDPLLLTGFLRATQEYGVPVLLLHNYPYHRHAGYLAQVFDHVFMDIGLATHNAGALSTGLIRESLELVPFGKLLYSSDAFGLPELYFLGSVLFRDGLSTVLGSLVEAGDMTPDDAARIVSLVGNENARRVYDLADPERAPTGSAPTGPSRTHE